jgi:uroporphyrinogen-III decarboxylase
MNGFVHFPSFSGHSYGYNVGMSLAETVANPEFVASLEKLQKAGKKMMELIPQTMKFNQGIAELGFPTFLDHMGIAPFDAISDHLRGMQGSMLDMYRQPDNLLEACDAILKGMLDKMPPPNPDSVNRVMIPLHRGSAGFMSIQQFEKFYWPGLKDYIMGLIERGYMPLVFFEGDYTDRLEYLLELPKGEVFAHMDMSDIFRAAEVLSGHLCFSGNLPCSLLQTGTVDDVKEAAKKMLEACTKNGGFIMSTRSPVDDAKPDTLKAFIDTTVEYGVY